MFKKLSINKLGMNGKRVFMRLDLDVPIKDGKVQCNQKILDALETIMFAVERGAKGVIMASHLGCPEGRKIQRFSLAPVAKEIETQLKRHVLFLDDCVGPKTELYCADPPPGSLILLENLFFHREEEGIGKNAAGTRVKAEPKRVVAFRESLSRLADVYVNEAFPIAHMNYSSILAQGFCPKAAGLLFMKELRYFSKTVNEGEEPFVLIVGGKRLSEKANLILHMLDCVQEVVVGGAVALMMLKVSKGMEIGTLQYQDPDSEDKVRKLLDKAKQKKVKIHLPTDFKIGDCLDGSGKIEEVTVVQGIPTSMKGLDIGPASLNLFEKPIRKAKTIIWNGPMGVYETEAYSSGTKGIIEHVARAAGDGCMAVTVGDDTTRLLKLWNKETSVSHLSIGGDASIVLLEGKDLPGIINLTSGKLC